MRQGQTLSLTTGKRLVSGLCHRELKALLCPLQCILDSEVAVRVGGEFFFHPQPEDASRNLVLIAGGVGINPLLSILRHAADLHRERESKGRGYDMGTVRLLYSAKDTSELLFKVGSSVCLD